jgi:hypothetical protein
MIDYILSGSMKISMVTLFVLCMGYFTGACSVQNPAVKMDTLVETTGMCVEKKEVLVSETTGDVVEKESSTGTTTSGK